MKYTFEEYKNPEIKSGHLNLGGKNPDGVEINLNSRYLTRGGKPWIPVMAEMHFSRISRSQWRKELLKTKAGGVTTVSTYLFWIYHEEEEGVLDFTGDNDVRAFVEECEKVGLDVVLRIGPWAHGECRNGGFPDWLLKKPFKIRCNSPEYLELVHKWYSAIYKEVEGLLYKDGGNVVAIQLENELVDGKEHLAELKNIAKAVGFDVPLYTVTGWNSAEGAAIPKYEVLPVFGGYTEAPWSGLKGPLPTSSHFFFHDIRNDSAIGTDIISKAKGSEDGIDYSLYPFATCELGGGIQVTHHRRPIVAPMDTYALSLIKIGCGNNLPGYYMYHGGTNKIGRFSTLQESKATGYPNDLAILNYDFQAPLGEYGLIREQYRLLKNLHYFLIDFEEEIAPMVAVFPPEKITDRNDTETFRYSMRTDGSGGYIFANNHQRMTVIPEKRGLELSPLGKSFPEISIGECECYFMPFNIELCGETLEYATAQPICRIGNTVFFMQTKTNTPRYKIAGCDELVVNLEDSYSINKLGGLTIVTVSNDAARYFYKLDSGVYLSNCDLYEDNGEIIASSLEDNMMLVLKWNGDAFCEYSASCEEKSASISISEIPEFDAEYKDELNMLKERKIRYFRLSDLPKDGYIKISYVGDVAQLYNGKKFVADEFYHGNSWLVPCKLFDGEALLAISELDDDIYLETEVSSGCELFSCEYVAEYTKSFKI